MVGSETEDFVKRVGNFVPCVSRNKAGAGQFNKIHFRKAGYQFRIGDSTIGFYFKNTQYYQRDIAHQKVRFYAVVALEIDGTRLKLRFHNTEAFLDFPSPVIDLIDFGNGVFVRIQARIYSIESVICLGVGNGFIV